MLATVPRRASLTSPSTRMRLLISGVDHCIKGWADEIMLFSRVESAKKSAPECETCEGVPVVLEYLYTCSNKV